MKIHFISIGGSVMHNLAIALHQKGYTVSGSDDEIFEPSLSRLKNLGLLPSREGWDAANIHSGLDAVILGMHARKDNPELLKAQELGLKIYSYPEYIYEQSKNKKRVVIGGSHGKTTITSMVMHVLKYWKKDFDYLVGSQLEGFDTMVRLTDKAPVIILEGDEYLASPIDPRPKFHLYHPDVALISGIGWDHINVFPSYENYAGQFRIFAEQVPENGVLVYCESDQEVKKICEGITKKTKKVPYKLPEYIIENGITCIETEHRRSVPLKVFGEHNLLNISGARAVCKELGIDDVLFYKAVSSFKGASRRLELVQKNDHTAVYRDFAHAPSKLKATIKAVKEQFPERKLVACMELHTFSSLNEKFIDQYKGTMEAADEAMVYFNPATFEHKRLKPLSPDQVKNAFVQNNIRVYTDSSEFLGDLQKMNWSNKNLLFMSSGNFDGIDFNKFVEKIINKLDK